MPLGRRVLLCHACWPEGPGGTLSQEKWAAQTEHHPHLAPEVSSLPTCTAGSPFELPRSDPRGSLTSLLQPRLHQQGREVAVGCHKGRGSVALRLLLN